MTDQRLSALRAEVQRIERHVAGFLETRASTLEAVHPAYRRSGENLLAYVAMRQLDLRRWQLELGEHGLSSLGRCEGYVRASLSDLLARLAEAGVDAKCEPAAPSLRRAEAEELLHQHTGALLGPRPPERHVSIMVTAPDEDLSEDACVALLQAGMNVLRINTAHGDETAWRTIVERARRVATRMHRTLRIAIDLAGPKLRTAAFAPGPAVVRYRPQKDALGRVVRALQIPVVGASTPRLRTEGPTPIIVPDDWIARMRVGDLLETTDTRDRARTLRVTSVSGGVAVAELDATTYLTPESQWSWHRDGRKLGTAVVAGVPVLAGSIELRVGDVVQLWLDGSTGEPGIRHPLDAQAWITPPKLGIELEDVVLDLKPEQRVLIDDGKIEAVIEHVDGAVARARVVRAAKAAVKVRAGKGVNFPDSEMRASALTAADRAILPVVLELADVVSLSFIRTPLDLRAAIAAIREVARDRQVGIIVKLETAYALQSLPGILLEAMRHFPVGVMIARGDLAVEVGFERLAELQQEILWFAEAAHLPVVWATQVLDSLARTGVPSRAEISDASMSVQAECVMLNKGPYVADACRTLDGILRKMEQHQFKKRSLYRPLRISLAMK